MILYFDPATSTGWAAGDQRGVKDFGTFVLTRTADAVGPFLNDMKRHVLSLMQKFKPVTLAYEAPILIPFQRLPGGKVVQRDTPAKLRKIYGLGNAIEMIADDAGLECVECNIGQVRLHFMGRGYPHESEAANTRMRVICRARGWNVKNSDEANALAGLDYLLAVRNPRHGLQAVPLFQSPSRRRKGERFANAESVSAATGRPCRVSS